MRKKIFSVIIILLVLLLALSGCTNYINANNPLQENESNDSYKELAGTLTVSTYFDSYMLERAKAFMKIYPKVKILVDFGDSEESDFETLEMYGSRIAVELMAGTAGDLIDLSNLSAYRYVKSDLFCDLYAFIESDLSFKKEDFYTNIFEAMEYEGKLYVIPFAFNYDIVYMSRAMFEKLSISIDQYDCLNYLQMLDIFERAKPKSTSEGSYLLMPGLVKESFFKYEFAEFYDTEKSTANFNSKEFLDYLTTTNKLNVEDSWRMKRVSEGNDSYMNSQYLFSKTELNAVDIHNFMIDYQNIIGPVPLVSSRENAYFDCKQACYGITKKSQNKELAWEFLKYCISEREAPSSTDEKESLDYFYRYEGWIPINIANFYSLFRTYCESDIERLKTSSVQFKDGDKKKVLEEALNQIHRWNLKRNKLVSDFELWDLVSEDLKGYYYYNISTAEEVASIIQNRVITYLNE